MHLIASVLQKTVSVHNQERNKSIHFLTECGQQITCCIACKLKMVCEVCCCACCIQLLFLYVRYVFELCETGSSPKANVLSSHAVWTRAGDIIQLK